MKPISARVLTVALAAALVASMTGLYGDEGALSAVGFLILLTAYRYMAWWPLVLFIVVLVGLLLPAVQIAREYGRMAACSNNMQQLKLAIEIYENANGHYPAAYTADADGKPMHSWRVRVLPFLDVGNLHDKYHFDKPWNDAANKDVIGTYLPIFQCPSHSTSGKSAKCNYVAITGPDTIWPGAETTKLNDVTDATGSTIVCIETVDGIESWAEPKDLSLDVLCDPKNAAQTAKLFSVHRSNVPGPIYVPRYCANVVFADTSIRRLSVDFLMKNLRALATRNGGEKIDLDEGDASAPRTDPWWLENVVRTAAVLSAVGLVVLTVLSKLRRKKERRKVAETQAAQ